MELLRSVLFQLAFVAFTLAMGLLCLPALLSARAARRVAHGWVKASLWLLAVICRLRADVQGQPFSGTAIYASKHQSALDTLILWQLLDGPVFILKRELLFIPIFGWYLARMQPIAINRRKRAGAIEAIRTQAVQALAGGRSIIIFPEGTRTMPGARKPYKTAGLSVLYETLQVPVVPVALNTGCYWARQALIKKPGRYILRFLPPIPPHQPVFHMLRQLEDSIEAESERLMREARGGAGAPPAHP